MSNFKGFLSILPEKMRNQSFTAKDSGTKPLEVHSKWPKLEPKVSSRLDFLKERRSQRFVLPSDEQDRQRLSRIASLKNFVARVKTKYSINTDDREVQKKKLLSTDIIEEKTKKEHRHRHHVKKPAVPKVTKPQKVSKTTEMSSLDKFFFTYEKKEEPELKTWLLKGDANTLEEHEKIPELCEQFDRLSSYLRRYSEYRRQRAKRREKDPKYQMIKFHFKPAPRKPDQEPRTFDYNRFLTNYPAVPQTAKTPVTPRWKFTPKAGIYYRTKKIDNANIQTETSSGGTKKKKVSRYAPLLGPLSAFRRMRRRRRPRRKFFNFNQPSPITGSYFSTKSGTYDSRPWLYRGNHKKRIFNYMVVPSKYSEETRLRFLRKYLMQIEKEQNERPKRKRRSTPRYRKPTAVKPKWPSFPFIKNVALEKGKLDKLLSFQPIKLSEICSDPNDLRQIFAALKIRSGLHAMSLTNPTSKMIYETCLRRELEDPSWRRSSYSHGEKLISSYTFPSHQNSAVIDPSERAKFQQRTELQTKWVSPASKPDSPSSFMARNKKKSIIGGLWDIMKIYDKMHTGSKLDFWKKTAPKRKLSVRTLCCTINNKGCPPQRPNTPAHTTTTADTCAELMRARRKVYAEYNSPTSEKIKLDLVSEKKGNIPFIRELPEHEYGTIRTKNLGYYCGLAPVQSVEKIPKTSHYSPKLIGGHKELMELFKKHLHATKPTVPSYLRMK